MRHLMGYVVAVIALLSLGEAARAADPAPPRAASLDRAAVRAAPARPAWPADGATATGNLDPTRGPVRTDLHAYPADVVDGLPYHSWRGYTAN